MTNPKYIMMKREATSDIKRRKIKGKGFLNEYLKELNRLVITTPIHAGNLLSLEETEMIKEKASGVRALESYKKTIPFEDKEKLRKYLNDLQSIRDNEFYLFTEYSNYCGAASVPGLNYFNWQFEFTAEHAGIISILLKDLSNELILDFYESNNMKLLEIEAFGSSWPNVLID